MKIVKYNDFRNISGKKLRELRISAKLSQQDLAEKLQLEGIDLTSKEISKIENNKRLVQDFEFVIYFWFLLLGLSGIVILSFCESSNGCKYLFLNLYMSVYPKLLTISFKVFPVLQKSKIAMSSTYNLLPDLLLNLLPSLSDLSFQNSFSLYLKVTRRKCSINLKQLLSYFSSILNTPGPIFSIKSTSLNTLISSLFLGAVTPSKILLEIILEEVHRQM